MSPLPTLVDVSQHFWPVKISLREMSKAEAGEVREKLKRALELVEQALG